MGMQNWEPSAGFGRGHFQGVILSFVHSTTPTCTILRAWLALSTLAQVVLLPITLPGGAHFAQCKQLSGLTDEDGEGDSAQGVDDIATEACWVLSMGARVYYGRGLGATNMDRQTGLGNNVYGGLE